MLQIITVMLQCISVLLVVKLRSRDIHRKLHLGRGAGRAGRAARAVSAGAILS